MRGRRNIILLLTVIERGLYFILYYGNEIIALLEWVWCFMLWTIIMYVKTLIINFLKHVYDDQIHTHTYNNQQRYNDNWLDF